MVHLPVSTGTLGDDMTEMMNHFVRGKTYLSTKDSDAVGKVEVNIGTVTMRTSSSPRAFPIIWGRRHGIEFSLSLLQESFHLVFCLPLRLFPGASNILLSTCRSSLLLTCPKHFSLFSVIFFVTGATFTDPLTYSDSLLNHC